MSTLRLQSPENFGGFSHDGETYLPDDEGVISVPAHLPTEVLVAHGLKPAAAKAAPKPLAKAAKGGVADDSSNSDEKLDDSEPKKPEEAKPAQKGAKAAKGGAE